MPFLPAAEAYAKALENRKENEPIYREAPSHSAEQSSAE